MVQPGRRAYLAPENNLKMQGMKRIIILITVLSASVFLLASCGGNGRADRKAGTESGTAGTNSATTALEVDELLMRAAELVGRQVTVEGVCTHICKHGSSKIFLMGTDDTQVIRIEAGKAIGGFKPECVNNLVRVAGSVVEERVDESYLAAWERQVKDQLAEQHGKGEAGCTAEQQARGESLQAGVEKRIADFRTRIAKRKAAEGKDYLSFYHLEGSRYQILD